MNQYKIFMESFRQFYTYFTCSVSVYTNIINHRSLGFLFFLDNFFLGFFVFGLGSEVGNTSVFNTLVSSTTYFCENSSSFICLISK